MMKVFLPHHFLMVPCSIFMTKKGPMHLYQGDGLILEHLEFLIKNTDWLDMKVSLNLHLNHVPINYMVSIRMILLKQ